jgi:hypothetical protein
LIAAVLAPEQVLVEFGSRLTRLIINGRFLRQALGISDIEA